MMYAISNFSKGPSRQSQIGKRTFRPFCLGKRASQLFWMFSFLYMLRLPFSAFAVDVNLFHPALGTGRMLTVDLGRVGPHLEVAPQIFFHYAYLPVGQYNTQDSLLNALDHRLSAQMAFSLSLFRRLQFGFSLPVTLYQRFGTIENEWDYVPGDRSLAGFEDAHISIKGVFFDSSLSSSWKNKNVSFGVGLLGDLSLPTGTIFNTGSPLPRFSAKLTLHLGYKRFLLAMNLGGLFAAQEYFGDYHTGHALLYGFGLQVEAFHKGPNAIYLVGEISGKAHTPLGDSHHNPAEALLSLKALHKQFSFFAGVGMGLNHGYGAPTVRAFAGISWAWSPSTAIPSPAAPLQNKLMPPVPLVELKEQKIQINQKTFLSFGQDTIRPEDYPLLNKVAELLRNYPKIKLIRIEGHTDNVGTETANVSLSLRRAQAVKAYLVSQGVEETRLTAEGFGFHCPISSNDTEEQRAQNRRVEFVIVQEEGQPLNINRCASKPK